MLEDRYHLHVLGTPAEARDAVRYVARNFAGHAARRGERVPEAWVDPFSSEGATAPRGLQGSRWAEPVTRAPESWLLRGADAAGRTATRPQFVELPPG